MARVRRAAVLWLVLFAAYAAGAGLHASPGEDLSGARGPRPAADALDRRRRQPRPRRRVRRRSVAPVLRRDAGAAHRAARARAARADRGRLPAADRARLRARRAPGRRAVAGGAGGAGLRRRRAGSRGASCPSRGRRARRARASGCRRRRSWPRPRSRPTRSPPARSRAPPRSRWPRASARWRGSRRGRGCCWPRCRGWACASSRPALVVLAGVFRWPRRRQRGLAGLVGVEVALFSAVLFVSINDRLYGGVTPYAVLPDGREPDGRPRPRRAPGALAAAAVAVGRAARGPAPVGAGRARSPSSRCGCSCARGASAWRGSSASRPTSRSPPASWSRSARPPRSSPSSSRPRSPGRGSPARQLVVVLPLLGALTSWGLRRFPRAGAVLGVITVLATVWVLVAVRADGDAGVAPPRGALPWTAVR